MQQGIRRFRPRLHSQKSDPLKESQKKYFSYNLDIVDQAVSKRQMKKRIAEELKTLSRENKLAPKQPSFRTVDVFTVEGRKTISALNATPVYNLEVFYPCPRSCSLTYNPKYTDVIMTLNDEGEMEIKCNTKTEKKSRKKHRKRFMKSDLATFNNEMCTFERDVEDMWREVDDVTEESENMNQDSAILEDQEDMVKTREEDVQQEEGCRHLHSLSDSILARLINEAELAKTHLNRACFRTRQRKKSSRTAESSISEDKETSHIVYIHDTSVPKQTKSESLNSPPQTSRSYPSLSSFPILVLSSNEVTPKALKEKFGNTYSEADCQPRRFCLNITEAVRDTILVSRRLISSMQNTYLIFTHTGIFDDGLETYRVTVNCAGCPEPESVSYSIPYGRTDLDKVIKTIVENLHDLKRAGHHNFSNESFKCEQTNFSPIQERIGGKQNIQVETYFTSDELSRLSESGYLQEEATATKKHSQSLMQLLTKNNVEQFCEICYDTIDCQQMDTVRATQLNACGHLFCNTCWQAHLRTQFREGAPHMVCPGYQCDTRIGPSTLLSLLHVTEVAQIYQRVCEDEHEVCPTSKWCPNPNCGRIIKLTAMPFKNLSFQSQSPQDLEKSLDVTCACGEEWCFTCLSPAHWPARCDQAQAYLNKAKTFKPQDDTLDPDNKTVQAAASTSHSAEVLEVEGRLCPKCRRFINKNGGCLHMSCKCGHQFCWNCLRPWDPRHFDCSPDPKTLKALTRIVKVRHMAQLTNTDLNQDLQSERETKSTNRHQKTSMFLKAVKQRQEAAQDKERHASTTSLVAKICKAIRTDMQLKDEVWLRFGSPKSNTMDWRQLGSVVKKDNVTRHGFVETLTKYLNAIQRSRPALHRVAEYTFVLLQDLPDCTEKRRALQVASDLIACCSFSQAVFQGGGNAHNALKRLSEIETWSNRALDTLLAVVHRLRNSV